MSRGKFADPNANTSAKSGVVSMNNKGLRQFQEIAQRNKNMEYCYLRENRFTRFVPYVALEKLKVLDLSLNNITGSVDFLSETPNLHHLYLTGNKISSLEGISGLLYLETLCLSDNEVTTFEGLDALPNLRVLSLNYNEIGSFHGYPYLPSLHTLSLTQNPVAKLPTYRQMAIAASNPSLKFIDNQTPIGEEERAAVVHYRGKLVYCIVEGYVIDNEGEAEEEADKFLHDFQRNKWASMPLQLVHCGLQSEDGGNIPREGVKLDLNICMQDMRASATRSTDVFFSQFIFPVAFKVSGDATEVLLVGSMNNWTNPIPLDRAGEGADVYFHTTLYLPAGDYEYRYIVDGTEKLNESSPTQSKFGQGACNMYHVAENSTDVDDRETILHVRWMRSNPEHGFELIEGQNGLNYTPTTDDIGYAIRAEALAYDKGNFSFLYFDISTPISSGDPTAKNLRIDGNVAEGDTLVAQYEYFGGNEGESKIKWYRLEGEDDSNPQEMDLSPEEAREGYTLSLDDIGKRIKVEVTPVREDWNTGEVAVKTTPIVTAGVPTCRNITITGELIQDQYVTAETRYSGGFEGESKFQWFRHDDAEDSFVPIPGETSKTYLLALADVGKRIAVEYVPVSRDSVEGETARLVLEMPIEASVPTVNNLVIKGQAEEHAAVSIEYDYSGGFSGSHKIEWFRKDASGSKRPIGRQGANLYTLTKHEINCTIEVAFRPVRSDGQEGSVVTVSMPEKVRAAPPQLMVFHVMGEPNEGSIIELGAEYSGGEEGESIIEWARAAADGSRDFDVFLRQKKRYVVQAIDCGRQIRVSYTPVRSDGVKGDTKQRWIAVPDWNAGQEEPPKAADTDRTNATNDEPNTSAEPTPHNAVEEDNTNEDTDAAAPAAEEETAASPADDSAEVGGDADAPAAADENTAAAGAEDNADDEEQ